MEYLSSMYIDNELNLDEKRLFVEKVRSDRVFATQTLELLAQEKLLREVPMLPANAVDRPWRPSLWTLLPPFFKPVGFATAGFTAAVLLLWAVFQTPATPLCNNRFVLFEPTASRVELAGSFTGWQRVSLQPVGDSGYWELNLPVPSGEHRFAYILDGNRRIADPTLLASELDDFGGKNSILNVEERI